MHLVTSTVHFAQVIEAKLHYIGAAAGSAFGFAANATGLSGNANSVLIVIVSAVGGGFVANLPKLLGVIYKKRSDDLAYVSDQSRSIIEHYAKISSDNEKIMALQVTARHDIQGEFQPLVSHIEYLTLMLRKENPECMLPEFKPFDMRARIKKLDEDISAVKRAGMAI